MMKIGVADYGMFVWEGGLFDYEQRARDLKAIGYDGMERLRPATEADALNMAARLNAMGCDFATVEAPTAELSIRWAAAFRKDYVWIKVTGKNFDDYCRQVNVQAEACERWGLKVALHNHLGSLVEKQDELDEFMRRCPKAALLLDAGHLAVAGGDVVGTAERYYDRLIAVHLKGWEMTHPEKEVWHERGYFCEIGGGNFPVPNAELVALLKKRGFDKWVMIEHDTHLREPLLDLKLSRERLRDMGV